MFKFGHHKRESALDSTIYLTSYRVLTAVVSVMFMAVFARLLSREQMALFAVATILGTIISTLCNLGLTTLAIREVPKYLKSQSLEDQTRAISLLHGGFYYTSMMSLILVILAFPFAGAICRLFFSTNEFADLIKIMVIGAFFSSVFDTLQNLQITILQFRNIGMLRFITQSLQCFFALIFFNSAGMPGFLWGIVLGRIAGVVMVLLNMRLYLLRRINLPPMLDVLKKAKAFYLAGWTRYAWGEMDQVILGVLTSPEVLAVYFIAKRVANYLNIFICSYIDPLSPRVSEYTHYGDDQIRRLFKRASRYLFMIFLPLILGVALLSDFGMKLVFGDKYSNGGIVLAVLAISSFFYGWNSLYSINLIVLGKPRDTLYKEFFTGTLSVTAVAIAVIYWQALGAALAQVVTLLTTVVFSRWLLRRHQLSIDTAILWKTLLASSFMVAVLLISQFLGLTIWALPIIIVLAGIIYVVALVRFMNADEFQDLFDIIPRFAKPILKELSNISI